MTTNIRSSSAPELMREPQVIYVKAGKLTESVRVRGGGLSTRSTDGKVAEVAGKLIRANSAPDRLETIVE